MKKLFLPIALFAMFIISSCEKKQEATPIESLTSYTDESTKFTIKYPSNWKENHQVGKRFFCATPGGASRFIKYDATGANSAKIDLQTFKLDSANTLDAVINQSKKFPPEHYSAPAKVTIDGVQATKMTYTFDLEDGPFNGEVYIASKDNKIATILSFETFAGTMATYRDKFDEITKSLVLAVEPVRKKGDTTFIEEQLPPASKTLKAFAGQGFSISIPDNYTDTKTKTASSQYSVMFSGDRRADCNIAIDIFDASKASNYKKTVEDNAAKIKGSAVKSMKIGGNEAYSFDYPASAKVKARMYFVFANKKMHRIVLTWFKDEEKDYLPVFESCVNSFKL